VHGHSSHHPRPLESYRGKLITHGCGDLINDYEGIGGYEEYRDDLRLLYFVTVDPVDGRFHDVRVVPMRSRRMRLEHATVEDSRWVRDVLSRISRAYGSRVELDPDGTLTVRPAPDRPDRLDRTTSLGTRGAHLTPGGDHVLR
jgi:poly-gamma-glutamate synthesis protein (capsule biosynthesis protein)